MSKLRYNKSKTYLLPLLSELVEFDKKFFDNLVNVYIYDDLGKYQNCLYILHDFSFRNPEFTAYENRITRNEYFVDSIDINNQVLYIFKFPAEYMHEYNKFIEGKYSQFGVDAKELILEFYTNIFQGNLNAVNFLLKLKQILFKDIKLKKQIEHKLGVTLSDDAELTDVIEQGSETFSLSKHEQIENKTAK
tara:strand:+ start:4180 stop:4752 length:573 start_codon:yes stop_codon:yes gene_type:complete